MSLRPLRAVCAMACVALFASCALHRRPALPLARPEKLGLSPAGLDRIGPALESFVDSGKVGGIYAIVVRYGHIGYERTFGRLDVNRPDPLPRNAVFRVYSMTKPVVAAGVLRLVDEGKLKLDDPVSKYVPAFAQVKVFAGGTADAPILKDPDSPITVRQLLNHTSGLAYGLTSGPVDTIYTRAKLYDASRTLEQFTDSLARIPLMFSPGTRWSYSAGFDVAGRVIEVASGRSLDQYLQEKIFDPLGMRDTGFRIRPDLRPRLVTVYEPGPDGASDLQRWNNLKGKKGLHAGQVLTLRETSQRLARNDKNASDKTHSAKAGEGQRQSVTYYKVRHGDSLVAIARRFSVEPRHLKSWNPSLDADPKPGQTLTLYLERL